MEQNRKINCEANETELGVKVLAEASEGGEPRDAQSSNDNTEKYLENEHQFYYLTTDYIRFHLDRGKQDT
ncbi:hypothetical protein pdam_00001208 [Pocillopora damicornis]|uniref:Uncharacterized protein n=1 Tax=Pocillopora damicornis TaxID=46731 RepID=A0A3M6TL32_POCDA|nr:hypothetical protein pdam_00001208 [Pocillopora damicornis]